MQNPSNLQCDKVRHKSFKLCYVMFCEVRGHNEADVRHQNSQVGASHSANYMILAVIHLDIQQTGLHTYCLATCARDWLTDKTLV
jgi:hypothetical protein